MDNKKSALRIKPQLKPLKFPSLPSQEHKDNFEIKINEDARGKFRWCITSKNGNIIDSSSQGFSTKGNCLKNLRLLSKDLDTYLKDNES